VIDRQPHLLTPYQQELLAQFSAMAMHEINHLRQARLCPLTAVLNRQALLAEGEPVIQKALLQGQTPVLVTVALAGLRQRNAEADGASWVDQHLERIAAVCRRHAWATGVVGRSGGGEFSLIWPDGSAVEQRLSDLKRELEAVTPPLQLRVVVTPAEGEATGLKLLLERAAAALR
jgi:GGDEF domain-containing protein